MLAASALANKMARGIWAMLMRVEALQADLDAWLVHYNTERPHLGYRNMGRRPVETIMSFVSQEG